MMGELNVVFYYRLINREQGLSRVCIRLWGQRSASLSGSQY